MTTTSRPSRRALLSGTALGVLVAPFAGIRPAHAARRSLYRRSRFARVFRRRFRLVDGEHSWTVTLTRISNLTHAARGDDRSFALTFRSRTAGPPQGTYVLRRRHFTPTELFVVPDASRRNYQAIVFRAPRR